MTHQTGRAWREVSVDEIGRGEREYVRYPCGMVWRFDERLVGIASCATNLATYMLPTEAFLAVGQRAQVPFDIVTDVSRVTITIDNAMALAATYDNIGPLVQVMAPLIRRHAGLVGRNFAAPYWKSITQAAGAQWEIEVYFESVEVWSWLGIDAAVGAEIDSLVEAVLSTPDVVTAVMTALREDPTLGLADVARRVGQSLRSLQRVLAAEGKTFASLRNDIRLERALALLERDLKLEAIATAIGFASTSHFTAWFRRLRGVTPSQLREAR